MAAQPKQRYTPEEYLALERQAEYKSEYVDGEIFAMAGASKDHNRLERNLIHILTTQFGDGPCEAFTSNMRVQIQNRRYYYPDVTVVCGEPVFEDAEVDTLLNPVVVFEVLSPLTEAYDRGRKAAFYRTLPSLSDYVLVAQDKPHIELYTRQVDGSWRFSEAKGLQSSLTIPSIDCTLALAEVYQRVQVSEADE